MKPNPHFSISSLFLCLVIVAGLMLFAPSRSAAQTVDSSVSVRIISDESEAVLTILGKRELKQDIPEQDWQHLFASEGYIRLKKREAAIHYPFTDEQFKLFVLSDSLLGKYHALKATLDKWEKIDVSKAAGRSLAYLPAGARIRAKIYPMIKPITNSFVFEVSTDPAIFLYLDPEVGPDEFENTLAHELHHIGYSGSCAPQADKLSEDTTLSKETRTVFDWIGAFGEGYAMLAAAGGPDIHPHTFGSPKARARWDNDMKNFNQDLKKVERFFLGVLDDKLKDQAIQDTAFSFFGIQGPWYTVGWKMAVTIEKKYGRPKLIECMCDRRLLFPTYNQAALEANRTTGDSLAVWSPELLQKIAK